MYPREKLALLREPTKRPPSPKSKEAVHTKGQGVPKDIGFHLSSESDDTPPTLLSLSFQESESYGKRSLNVTAVISDDMSGFAHGIIHLISENGNDFSTIMISDSLPTDLMVGKGPVNKDGERAVLEGERGREDMDRERENGNGNGNGESKGDHSERAPRKPDRKIGQHTFHGFTFLHPHSVGGKVRVKEIVLSDLSLNEIVISLSTLSLMPNVQTEIEIAENIVDKVSPSLLAISPREREIYIGQYARFDLKLSDDISGVKHVVVRFASPRQEAQVHHHSL